MGLIGNKTKHISLLILLFAVSAIVSLAQFESATVLVDKCSNPNAIFSFSAFVEVNNAMSDPNLIPSLVRKGYLIRTMTDPNPQGVRANDTAKRDASMISGAQTLSTDYPYDEGAGSGYAVRFDHGNVRCNPVLKPAACDSAMLGEDPRSQQ